MTAQEGSKLRRKLRDRGYNLTKRFVAGEAVLHSINYKGSHELWRALNVYKDGLTPKEKELLEQTRAEMDAINKRLGKIAQRLRYSGDDGNV